MSKRSLPRGVQAGLAAVFFLALGLVAIWMTKWLADVEGDAIAVAILVAPIVTYAIFTGRLSELRAGSLEARFVVVAGQALETASSRIEPSWDDFRFIQKGSPEDLLARTHDLDESKPIILNVMLGEGRYSAADLIAYINALTRYRSFNFVTFTDADSKIVAYIQAWRLARLLQSEPAGDDVISIVNEGRRAELRSYPGFITETSSGRSTYLDALREMTDQNLDALVVTDDQGNLRGVLGREHLLAKLVLGIAG
jgi:CBS domain-containing protein